MGRQSALVVIATAILLAFLSIFFVSSSQPTPGSGAVIGTYVVDDGFFFHDTKVQNGMNITRNPVLNIVFENGSLETHFYIVHAQGLSFSNVNIAKQNFSVKATNRQTVSNFNVSIFPIDSFSYFNDTSYTQDVFSTVPCNQTIIDEDGNSFIQEMNCSEISEVPINKPKVAISYKAPVTKISSSTYYLVALTAPPFEGNYNITISIGGQNYLLDPNVWTYPYVINSSGAYVMNASCTLNGSTCVTINASSVTFDCGGTYTMTGNNSSSTSGIEIFEKSANITGGCSISNFQNGIYFVGSSAYNGTIDNAKLLNSTHSSGRCVQVTSATTSINNIDCYSFSEGVRFGANSDNSNLNKAKITITGSGYGVDVISTGGDNISIDCSSFAYPITGSNSSASYGVYSARKNTTIKNCNVSNFMDGLWIVGTYAYLLNNTVTTTFNATTCSASANCSAIRMGSTSSYSQLINNTATSAQQPAISLTNSPFSNLTGGSATLTAPLAASYAIYARHNNTIFGVNQSAYTYVDTSATSTFTQDCNGLTLTAAYGRIVDSSNGITIVKNCISNTTSATNSMLFQRQAGTMYSINNTANGMHGLQQNVQGVIFDCNGTTLTGNNTSAIYGLQTTSSSVNSTLRNCIINNFVIGARLSGAVNFTVTNNTISSTSNASSGVYITSNANNNTIFQNTLNLSGSSTTGAYGVYVTGGNNTMIDCNGAAFTGNNMSSSYGVYNSQVNTTVQNCNISNFQIGIYFTGGTYGNIINTTSATTYNGGSGVYLATSADYNNITNITATAAGTNSRGIYLSASNNIVINGSTGTSPSSYGIYLVSTNNTVLNNCSGFSNTNIGIALQGANYSTLNNTNGYNTVSGASSYGIRLNSLSNNNVIWNSTASSVAATAVYFTNGSGNTFDCQGKSLIGTNTTGAYGIYNDHNSTTIKNCNISNYHYAIYLDGAKNGSYINNTLTPDDSKVRGLVYIAATSYNNLFYWNNFTNTSSFYVTDLNGSNYWNSSTEGNVWYNVQNGSILVYGTVSSTGYPALYRGSSGGGVPYNNTTSGNKFVCNFVGCGDYIPLTPYLLGNPDTKIWLWNGSDWVDFELNDINWRCSNPFPTYCQPQNQNNATSQPIIRDQNNGSQSSAWQAIKTNVTWSTANLSCGAGANPSSSTILTTSFTNYSTSTLAVGANNSLYCWFYIASVPSNFTRDFSINFTKG